MSDTSASEEKINKLCASVGCSKDGTIWLTNSLDVFKDMAMKTEGAPDTNTSPSLTRVIKQSIQISAPPSVPVGANWQAHIFLDPMVKNEQMFSTTFPAGFAISAAGQVAGPNTGGLTVRSGPMTSDLTVSDTTANLPLQDNFATPSTRILGMGFEVHDVTAEIDKAGACTVYRKFAPHLPGSAINTLINPAVLTQRGATEAFLGVAPPSNVAAALLLPFSKQWESKHGCYCVSTMSSQLNDPFVTPFRTRILGDTKLPVGRNWFPQLTIDAVNNVIVPDSSIVSAPFNISGAFFTGLKNSASLLINVNYLTETFPNETDLEIITLATPSPPFDPQAIELYAKTAAALPAGVKVRNNASGDWIKGIAAILGTVGVPGMPLVSAAVDLYNMYSRPTPPPKPLPLSRPNNSPWTEQKPVITRNPQQQQLVQRQVKKKPLPPIPTRAKNNNSNGSKRV